MGGFKLGKIFNVVDLIVISYLIDTLILSFFIPEPRGWIHPTLFRLLTFTAIGFVLFHDNKYPSKVSNFIRFFYPVALLTYIYGETAQFGHIFFSAPLDGYLSSWEHSIFGFQPALEFDKAMPQAWFRELMNFGYFVYYLFTFGFALAAFYLRKKEALKILFIIIFSFLTYYIFFIIFPSEGPQFYFLHGELPPPQGVFGHLVYWAQEIGEAPTGAFPSSHVGMMVIFCWISYKYFRKSFIITLFFTAIITLATVYIKAHYAIDIVAAYISAPILIYLSNRFYTLSIKVLEK